MPYYIFLKEIHKVCWKVMIFNYLKCQNKVLYFRMYKSALKLRCGPSVKLLKILIKIVAAEICARFGVEGNPVPSFSWPTPPNPPWIAHVPALLRRCCKLHVACVAGFTRRATTLVQHACSSFSPSCTHTRIPAKWSTTLQSIKVSATQSAY